MNPAGEGAKPFPAVVFKVQGAEFKVQEKPTDAG
jgi:hypothetical protein